MNSLDIEKRFMQYFVLWQHYTKDRTARVNRQFTPPSDGVWWRVTFIGGINQFACMAQRPCVREVGQVVVQFFVAENAGTAEIKRLADSLCQHLHGYDDVHLELLAPSIVNVTPSHGFYQINVSVPYRYLEK